MAGIKLASFVRKLKNPSKGRESNFDFNTELLAGLQRPCFQCWRLYHGCIHGCRRVKGDTVGSSSFRLSDYPPSPLSSLFNYLAHREKYYNIPAYIYITDTHFCHSCRRISHLYSFYSYIFLYLNFQKTLQDFRLKNIICLLVNEEIHFLFHYFVIYNRGISRRTGSYSGNR